MIPGPRSVSVEFTCSTCICVSSLRVHQLPPTVQKHAKRRIRVIAYSKLAVGVNECEWLCLYVNPSMNWRLAQGVPRLHPPYKKEALELEHTPT